MESSDQSPIFKLVPVVLIIASAVVIGIGVANKQADVSALGFVGLVIAVMGLLRFMEGAAGGGSGSNDEFAQKQISLLESINEHMLLSDQAKRIAFRQNERQALREAIVEDIRAESYDEALAMVNDMTELYGQHEDAEEFRQEILSKQSQTRQKMLDDAREKIAEICDQRQWALAMQETARLQRIYPESPDIATLTEEVNNRRERYKADLIREFKEAHDRQDTNRATELLHVMDQYLSEAEAAPYAEMARDVLRSAKDNLGVRFKMSLQDQDFIAAVQIGEQLQREYPNSAYAVEVAGMMDKLREKAQAQRADA
jgi:outer membrane protein assembly factor BamD (BamD/ComL family)